MRPRLLERILAAAIVASSLACASRREPLPTIEDYSDGTSIFAAQYLEEWKAGRAGKGFYAPDFAWSGPLPGEGMERVETRAGLEVSVWRRVSPSPQPSPRGREGADHRSVDLVARLSEIRAAFASLGRTENVLFDFRRRGERREVVFGLLLTGRGGDGRLRQEGGQDPGRSGARPGPEGRLAPRFGLARELDDRRRLRPALRGGPPRARA